MNAPTYLVYMNRWADGAADHAVRDGRTACGRTLGRAWRQSGQLQTAAEVVAHTRYLCLTCKRKLEAMNGGA